MELKYPKPIVLQNLRYDSYATKNDRTKEPLKNVICKCMQIGREVRAILLVTWTDCAFETSNFNILNLRWGQANSLKIMCVLLCDCHFVKLHLIMITINVCWHLLYFLRTILIEILIVWSVRICSNAYVH